MKRCYSHLMLADRGLIERWRLMKMSATEIARRLGRHRSTVFRELRRKVVSSHQYQSDTGAKR